MRWLQLTGILAICVCIESAIGKYYDGYTYHNQATGLDGPSTGFVEETSGLTGTTTKVGSPFTGQEPYGNSESFQFSPGSAQLYQGSISSTGEKVTYPWISTLSYPSLPTYTVTVQQEPQCQMMSRLKKQISRIVEPILLGGFGAVIIWVVKAILLPYIGRFTVRMGRVLEDADQSALDRLSESIQVISSGVCLQRIACQLGKNAKEYHIIPSNLRVIKHSSKPESLLAIFRKAATEDIDTCDKYSCLKATKIEKPTHKEP